MSADDHETRASAARAYDAWYDTPRGRWIGEREYALAHRLLAPQAGDTLLDVGCGTGWFTRRFAQDGLRVTGVDRDEAALAFARAHAPVDSRYRQGDACALNFPDDAFDRVVSIAALCFTGDERAAVCEAVRVARRRVVIGWLNRHSLLYRQKGRPGGEGAYRGARWHDAGELRRLVAGLPLDNLVVRSVVFLPDGGWLARRVETLLPASLPWGSLLFIAGDKRAGC